jgi:hypothetical protein
VLSKLSVISRRFVIMKRWIAAAIVTGVLALAGPASAGIAAAASQVTRQVVGSSEATDISARRYRRHDYRYGYAPHYRPYPYYYARPSYYRPYPYDTPAPFTFGIGFGPFWW